jgi:hypothetical protein
MTHHDFIKTDPEHESTSQDAPVSSQFPESDEPSEDVFMDPLQVAIFKTRLENVKECRVFEVNQICSTIS